MIGVCFLIVNLSVKALILSALTYNHQFAEAAYQIRTMHTFILKIFKNNSHTRSKGLKICIKINQVPRYWLPDPISGKARKECSFVCWQKKSMEPAGNASTTTLIISGAVLA